MALKYGFYRRQETHEWMTGSSSAQRVITTTDAVGLARRNRDQLIAACNLLARLPNDADEAAYVALQAELTRVAPDVQGTSWGHRYLSLMYPDIGTETGPERMELPGFLFDMNRFFQDALERFLREWLEGATVLPQYRLRDVFKYDPRFNPRRRQSPTPKPDYVLSKQGRVVTIADAKYRDLWEQSLPPAMLYQLSVYALSQGDCRTATILYATTTSDAREARIAIRDPIHGGTRAYVVLRPVCLPELAQLVGQPRTTTHDRRRREYAAYLMH